MLSLKQLARTPWIEERASRRADSEFGLVSPFGLARRNR
jgi:hypothetical protein